MIYVRELTEDKKFFNACGSQASFFLEVFWFSSRDSIMQFLNWTDLLIVPPVRAQIWNSYEQFSIF